MASSAIPPLDRAQAALGEDTPTSRVLVTAHLLANGTATSRDATQALPIGTTAVKQSFQDLVDAGLAEYQVVETETNGQDPYLYEPAGSLARAHDADAVDNRKDSVVETLATLHYRKHLSNATAARIAKDTEGLSSKNVARTLERLEDEGIVERVLDTQTKRWRLVAPEDHAPYRAGGSE